MLSAIWSIWIWISVVIFVVCLVKDMQTLKRWEDERNG
jgi:hypothetical protein